VFLVNSLLEFFRSEDFPVAQPIRKKEEDLRKRNREYPERGVDCYG